MRKSLSFLSKIYFFVKIVAVFWAHQKTSVRTQLIIEDGREEGEREPRSTMAPQSPGTNSEL